jgi:hypothetical protein
MAVSSALSSDSVGNSGLRQTTQKVEAAPMNTMISSATMVRESRSIPKTPILEQLIRTIIRLGSHESLERTFARAIDQAFEDIARESRN